MKISLLGSKTSIVGTELIPIIDMNESDISRRNKIVQASLLRGLNGQNGAAGASAYQVWLAAGNTGSTSDFFDYLTGDIGINPKGPYSGTTTYVTRDAVSFNGSSWISIRNSNQGNVPVEGE